MGWEIDRGGVVVCVCWRGGGLAGVGTRREILEDPPTG